VWDPQHLTTLQASAACYGNSGILSRFAHEGSGIAVSIASRLSSRRHRNQCSFSCIGKRCFSSPQSLGRFWNPQRVVSPGVMQLGSLGGGAGLFGSGNWPESPGREIMYLSSVKVKLSPNRPWRPIGLWDVKDPTLSRQSAHRWW
jgi:hypothetical protein